MLIFGLQHCMMRWWSAVQPWLAFSYASSAWRMAPFSMCCHRELVRQHLRGKWDAVTHLLQLFWHRFDAHASLNISVIQANGGCFAMRFYCIVKINVAKVQYWEVQHANIPWWTYVLLSHLNKPGEPFYYTLHTLLLHNNQKKCSNTSDTIFTNLCCSKLVIFCVVTVIIKTYDTLSYI